MNEQGLSSNNKYVDPNAHAAAPQYYETRTH